MTEWIKKTRPNNIQHTRNSPHQTNNERMENDVPSNIILKQAE
jgi:hypothetical protein